MPLSTHLNILESLSLFAVVAGAEAYTLAQAATPSLESVVAPLIQSFGIPSAWLAVVAYTIRKIVLWGMPRAERIIESHISRQSTMADCQRSLTESTVAIQQENQRLLNEINGKLPRLCQAQPSTTRLS
ncbi:hypothetical protein UFOVP1329_6 [uncultured Caudovirales phage]|uniref:Uncharacterized protein n=1 Tax=uncultured Caudovirales phage TaxID=2100421 RepID=A0A6J5RX85_9CAUD|nr:hypothetical protein UFOVP1150_31 [uncultured Caudovirales phage]CAB4198907.1 hypothetical protein UFOVP1329_6 [uncultured Caudovirales phage]CAB4218658.1 hypothetical protein UFOVP1595_30 [uncultured Caudovirales phage]